MKFTDILNRLFGDNPAPVGPPAPPVPQPKRDPNYTIPDDCLMQSKKVVSQLDLIGRSYGLPIWAPQSKEDHQHDWGVMLAHDDLQSVSLELIAADKTVPYWFKFHFARKKAKGRVIDSANGVELPVLFDHASVTSHRLIIQQRGRESVYRHLLKIGWGPAETLRKRRGNTFASEHASKITGGRQTAKIHVSAEARQRLVVTQTGNDGYAFGDVPARGWKGVFLHKKFAPPGLQFRIGQQITALLVQVPRGVQARAIQQA